MSSLPSPVTLEAFTCHRCGQCCRSAFFLVDKAYTQDGLDHLEWARFHNFRTEFREKDDGRRWWGISLDKPCKHIVEQTDGTPVCAIYENRPQMCRNYSCQP